MHTVEIMYPGVIDIGCFSHTLDLAGTDFKTPTLDKFMKHWVKLFRLQGKIAMAREDWTITQALLANQVME